MEHTCESLGVLVPVVARQSSAVPLAVVHLAMLVPQVVLVVVPSVEPLAALGAPQVALPLTLAAMAGDVVAVAHHRAAPLARVRL